ncbi:MAG: enoyl-CoA hydratase/isomerase family protein [Desulfarculales bacterium]|jgi:2-(1,2-epoxy-1,2-dihydrophenyl)acetyl-CoA isomerase|nr:enoyl-CoA hydratase/isomerase family protein [Desulfarculales bacterium]
MEENVLYKTEGAVATVTLNRPAVMNSLNWDLCREAVSILDRADKDESVRAVVFTGAGKAFCAGGDLGMLKGLRDAAERYDCISMGGGLLAEKLRALNKPVIAMVNGVAAGAGFNLALSSDIIIASVKARFAQSFSLVGLVPDAGGHYLLPRIVGLAKAKELMFTGDMISAEEALRLGLINWAVSEDELAEKTYALAARLAAGPPLALKFIKKALNRSMDDNWGNVLEAEAAHQAICLCTEDHQEGVKAFFEKRPPQFKGR